MQIVEQIEETKREMLRTKPRSRRMAELEIRLRNLRVKQLKSEMRSERHPRTPHIAKPKSINKRAA